MYLSFDSVSGVEPNPLVSPERVHVAVRIPLCLPAGLRSDLGADFEVGQKSLLIGVLSGSTRPNGGIARLVLIDACQGEGATVEGDTYHELRSIRTLAHPRLKHSSCVVPAEVELIVIPKGNPNEGPKCVNSNRLPLKYLMQEFDFILRSLVGARQKGHFRTWHSSAHDGQLCHPKLPACRMS